MKLIYSTLNITRSILVNVCARLSFLMHRHQCKFILTYCILAKCLQLQKYLAKGFTSMKIVFFILSMYLKRNHC